VKRKTNFSEENRTMNDRQWDEWEAVLGEDLMIKVSVVN
jgi:hypothetical protein